MSSNVVMEFDAYKIVNDQYIKQHDLYDEIKQLWIRNNAGIDDMDQRASEVIAAVLYDGFIVGVMSRKVIPMECQHIQGKQVAYIRIFIGVVHRGFKLYTRLFWSGIDIIRQKNECEGIVLNTENRKYEREGYRRRFKRNGFESIPSELPHDVWYLHF